MSVNFPITYSPTIQTETRKIGETVHTHKVLNGTYYHRDTPDEVVRALELAREKGYRVRIFCGDTATGVAWQEENDIMGRMGRSGGTFKVPLLIANARSHGGPHILDHCIVGIRLTGKHTYQHRHQWLYKHPNFSVGTWGIRPYDAAWDAPDHLWSVTHNGEEFGRVRGQDKALRLAHFMRGDRDSK